MNSNLKNTTFAILSIAVILPAILFISDYIHFQEPLSRVGLYPDDPKCDAQCVEKINESYKCVEIKPDEFVCRQKRGTFFSEPAVRESSAAPISYGEIVPFPEGKPDFQWFNVENIKILDKNSKTIQVDFNESQDIDTPSDIIYTAKLTSGDDYVSCVNPWKGTHLVRYIDLFEHESKTYVEFWGLHPFTPPELFPFDVLKILEFSLRTNYDEISLPKYNEFGFD